MTEIFHIFASVTRPLTQSYTGQYDGQHAKNDKRQKINDSATTEKPVGDLGRRTPPGIRRIGSYDPQRPQRTRRTEPADSDPRRSDRPPQHRGREQGGHADPQQAVFNTREKQAIGRVAATLIEENDTILLDSGTTTLEIARNLHKFQRLTIITNSINIAAELLGYKRFNIILLGGNLRGASQSTVGPIAEMNLKVFYCDKLFLGVDSFNIECGLSTPNIEEANINQMMLSMSKRVIAVFDSSKCNKRSFAFIAPVDKIDVVVSDSNLPANIRNQLRSMQIKVYAAEVHP